MGHEHARAEWRLCTPTTGGGAVAVICVTGDVDWALTALEIRGVGMERARVREVLGVDQCVVVRWTERCLHIMPHAGPAILRQLSEAFESRGLKRASATAAWDLFPEAGSELEARMLVALAGAASPMAIDLLLAQPELWTRKGAASDPARDVVLQRLLVPPLVVALGPPNVGKSTLVNVLAGRSVSLVADMPGTTRDHVGVSLDLGGLVVRYLDTPGLRAEGDDIERAAIDLTLEAARGADLIVHCGDAGAGPPDIPPELAGIRRVSVGLRGDLGRGTLACDVWVSGLNGDKPRGVEELVGVIREALVPEELRRRQTPWKFWE